ncbi:hypothetical protein ACFFRR_005329 [Megaselia abdita]
MTFMMTEIRNFNEECMENNTSGIQTTLNIRQLKSNKHFKNPPQPHMCIQANTDKGEEIFINVLSWTRIVEPKDISDPIPLYGGMRIFSSKSPKCSPLVYAVMANPEVLKFSGRHCKDNAERNAIVELMCEFVEAMNENIKLNRNAFILQDRDISGELKDVWSAVQAQREKEREDVLLKQKQRQISSLGNIFSKIDETIIFTDKINEVEVLNSKSEGITNISAITKEQSDDNDIKIEVNIIEIPEKVDLELNSEESKVEAPIRKEKTSFLQNSGIFPKIKINRKFTKTKNKVCSVVSTNENNSSNLEEDIEKLNLNKIQNKINTKKNPSEVWC